MRRVIRPRTHRSRFKRLAETYQCGGDLRRSQNQPLPQHAAAPVAPATGQWNNWADRSLSQRGCVEPSRAGGSLLRVSVARHRGVKQLCRGDRCPVARWPRPIAAARVGMVLPSAYCTSTSTSPLPRRTISWLASRILSPSSGEGTSIGGDPASDCVKVMSAASLHYLTTRIVCSQAPETQLNPRQRSPTEKASVLPTFIKQIPFVSAILFPRQ